MQFRVIGYGVCGGGESRRYLRGTLDEFARLCDEAIILGNHIGEEERRMIISYGFYLVEDDREWGRNQHRIKEDFVRTHVAALRPDITVCIDMDERFVNLDRHKLEQLCTTNDAFYVYIVNLWNEGYRSDWSFWNVRFWSWMNKEKYGNAFFKFENRPLHCGLAPKWCYALNVHAPVVLEHYGLKDKSDRQKKIERYEKYDPKQVYRSPQYYQSLRLNTAEPYNKEHVVQLVEHHIDSIKQPLHKELPMAQNNNLGDKVLVMREYDGLVFEVHEKFLAQQLARRFKGQGFRKIERKKPDTVAEEPKPEPKVEEIETKTEETETETAQNVCDTCGFAAKSEFGLRVHKRKHQ